jgi:prepilin-type N-terminal cleavage/methylation domain-containing protein
MNFKRNNRFGFTLVELLVVISIIATLLAILIPSLQKAREQAKKAICRANLHSIGTALLAYEVANGRAPLHYSELVKGDGGAEMMSDEKGNDVRPLWENYLKTLNIFKCPSLPPLNITTRDVPKGTRRVYSDYFIAVGFWGNFNSKTATWSQKRWTRMSDKWNFQGARRVAAGDRIILETPYSCIRMNHKGRITNAYTRTYELRNSKDYIITYSEVEVPNQKYDNYLNKCTANYLFSDGSVKEYNGGDKSLVQVPLPNLFQYRYCVP